MDVYVLVLVTYDYYRFQSNYGVFKSIDEAKKHANTIDSTIDCLCYNFNYEETMDDQEIKHWCVQCYCL